MQWKVDISIRRTRFAIGDRERYTAPQLSLYIIMIVRYDIEYDGGFLGYSMPDFWPMPGF